jgi:hypothetical protein
MPIDTQLKVRVACDTGRLVPDAGTLDQQDPTGCGGGEQI